MKKKTEKKLVLTKETLKSLETSKLQEILGGADQTNGFACGRSAYCSTSDPT